MTGVLLAPGPLHAAALDGLSSSQALRLGVSLCFLALAVMRYRRRR